MAFELREGQGSLFKNDHKTSDRHPDYKGSVKCHDGVEYDLAAWIKEKRDGGKFMSVQISHKRVKEPGEDREEKPELNDEIPF